MTVRVSVITPTYRRPGALLELCKLFNAQTWPEKELIILDDSPEPHPSLRSLRDPNIRYVHMEERATIGEKRHRLVAMARGDVIAHFDDDDYYAPGYLSKMVTGLGDGALVKLSAWFGYDQASGLTYYWDTDKVMPYHWRIRSRDPVGPVRTSELPNPEAFAHSTRWGYGFSYVFSKAAYERVQFDRTLNRGEDYDFVRRLMEAKLRVSGFPDEDGLAVHVIHERNTAGVFPNFLLPRFAMARFFGPEALKYVSAHWAEGAV
jgi:glycosyltransferase involved in cell wall biosynthesis